MHARYFSAHLGRFQSVDPLGVAPEWPQSWNRYTYVLGNPMKYTDPRGLYWNLFQQVPNPFLFFGQTTSASTNVPLSFSVLGLLSGPGSSSSFGFALFGATPNPQAPTQPVNPQCSTVPQAPPGVDVDRNLSLVAATRNILGMGHSTALVVGASAPGSIWDFKVHHGSQYENFGNFHFGAASAVAGIPEGVALRGAGLVQISFSRTQYDWIYSQGLTPLPGQNPPFGDDPRDQQQIRLGYFWYENCP